MPRTADSLRSQLIKQLKALRSSLEAFHRGDRWEAARMATTCANLVYDGKRRNRSILSQMGARDSVIFMVTGGDVHDANLIDEHPLANVDVINDEACFTPLFFSNQPRPGALFRGGPFDAWWQCPVYKTGGRLSDEVPEPYRARLISRGTLILTFRDQDGGAHFDEDISDETYRKLTEDGGPWFLKKEGDDEAKAVPMFGVLEASMAQVAYEVANSITSHFTDIPTNLEE